MRSRPAVTGELLCCRATCEGIDGMHVLTEQGKESLHKLQVLQDKNNTIFRLPRLLSLQAGN